MDEHSRQQQPDPYRAARQFELFMRQYSPGFSVDAIREDQQGGYGTYLERRSREIPRGHPKGQLIARGIEDPETHEIRWERIDDSEISDKAE